MQYGQKAGAIECRSDWLRDCWNITPSGRSQFNALQRNRSHSNCRISEISITPCQGQRDENEISQTVDDGLYVTFYKSGGLFFKAGETDVVTQAGDLLLWNPASPASFRCETPSLGQTIIFPRKMVERRLGNWNFIGNVRADRGDARINLLKSHLLQVFALPDNFDERFSRDLLEITLELVFLCVDNLKHCEKKSYNEKVYDRILREIQYNILSDELSPGKISAIVGLSVRRMQSILACRGETFTFLVNKERLIYAKKLLLSSEWKGRSIAELACFLGFYDGSHFSNAFRRYYKVSPQKFRKCC